MPSCRNNTSPRLRQIQILPKIRLNSKTARSYNETVIKNFIPVLTFVFVFFLSFQVISDTDFGWHLRAGEYIFKTKSIPIHDIFSFSQPNYPYVFHSWAAELLIFASYQLLGLYGVSLLFAATSTASLFFIAKATPILNNNQISYPLFIIAAPLVHAVAGERVRDFGLLFFSLFYLLFVKFNYQNSRLIWLTPLIFFFWVNFHGSFVLGISSFLILIATSHILAKNKKIQIKKTKTLLAVLIVSLSTTLANPYFVRAWQQALTMSINSFSQVSKINADWGPLISLHTTGWIFATFVAIILLLTVFFKTKVDTFQKILVFVFFIFSLLMSRFSLSLLVFFIPAAHQVILEIQKKLSSQITNSFSVKTSTIALFTVLFLTIIKNLADINFAYSSLENYSKSLAAKFPKEFTSQIWSHQASIYFQENLKSRRVLNEGNWGGYLLLQNPNLKVFYWGAMDNFFTDGRSFAYEYLDIVMGAPDWQEKIEEYQIDAVFLPLNYPLVSILKHHPNWQTVYEDSQAVILIKN